MDMASPTHQETLPVKVPRSAIPQLLQPKQAPHSQNLFGKKEMGGGNGSQRSIPLDQSVVAKEPGSGKDMETHFLIGRDTVPGTSCMLFQPLWICPCCSLPTTIICKALPILQGHLK